MCNLSEGIRDDAKEKGRVEGKIEGMLEAIQKLIINMHLTAEQVMDALMIPVEERAKYISKL